MVWDYYSNYSSLRFDAKILCRLNDARGQWADIIISFFFICFPIIRQ